MNSRRWQICLERKSLRLGAVVLLAAAACSSKRERGPDLQITDESVRVKQGTALPATSPIFDGKQVRLRMARGETFGLQVLTTKPQSSAVAVSDPAIVVQPFQQTLVTVKQGSTDMYGGGMRGAGAYADGLQAVSQPSGELAWFDITVPATHPAGTVVGTVTVGGVALPLQIDIVDVQLRLDAPLRVWAYYDERELAWAAVDQGRCVAMFRQHGVLAATTLDAAQWPTYRAQFEGARYVPVRMRKVDDAAQVKQIVGDWVAATQGSGIVPFAIPIDEPRTDEQRAAVRAGAELVRQSGGGPGRFLFAVTDDPQSSYGDLVDLYFTLWAKHGQANSIGKPIWTYNGRPPGAGSMVVDAASLSTRTWGVIGQRYNIDVWYIWDGLYWHDRHNRDRALDGDGDPRRLDNPNRGRAVVAATDAMSFLSKDHDVGNLDGVIAYPDAQNGCAPSLRLKQLRRGLYDRALIEAANCTGEGDRIAATLMPRALGDAPRNGVPAWSEDPHVWAAARDQLISAAATCTRKPN